MEARCVTPFFDKQEGKDREPGEVFECTDERFKAINATEFGVLAEAVAQPKAQAKPRARKATKKE